MSQSGTEDAPIYLQAIAGAKVSDALRQQMRDEGVNFAGLYTLASMGCGTGCSMTAIVVRALATYFPKRCLLGPASRDYDLPKMKTLDLSFDKQTVASDWA